MSTGGDGTPDDKPTMSVGVNLEGDSVSPLGLDADIAFVGKVPVEVH